jgi:hypothetical protein
VCVCSWCSCVGGGDDDIDLVQEGGGRHRAAAGTTGTTGTGTRGGDGKATTEVLSRGDEAEGKTTPLETATTTTTTTNTTTKETKSSSTTVEVTTSTSTRTSIDTDADADDKARSSSSHRDAKTRALALIDEDRLLEAARVLREANVPVPSEREVLREVLQLGQQGGLDLADAKFARCVSKATLVKELITSLKTSCGELGRGWKTQGEHMAGLYKLNSADPELESAWFQPLNLKYDILVSKFAFKINLYRYNTGRRDVSIYYRTHCTDPGSTGQDRTAISARIESPIDKTMLAPFLAALNETELYFTWYGGGGGGGKFA